MNIIKQETSYRDSINLNLWRLSLSKESWCNCLVVISLENDEQIKEMKKCIDPLLKSYYDAIHKTIKDYYHTDVCGLSDLELKTLSYNFFINFYIYVKGKD